VSKLNKGDVKKKRRRKEEDTAEYGLRPGIQDLEDEVDEALVSRLSLLIVRCLNSTYNRAEKEAKARKRSVPATSPNRPTLWMWNKHMHVVSTEPGLI